MPIKEFTIKTHHFILQCDVCNHVEEYEYEERSDLADQEQIEYRENQAKQRKKHIEGWNYAYTKFEPIWESFMRFEQPSNSQMKQVLMCPMCSGEKE